MKTKFLAYSFRSKTYIEGLSGINSFPSMLRGCNVWIQMFGLQVWTKHDVLGRVLAGTCIAYCPSYYNTCANKIIHP